MLDGGLGEAGGLPVFVMALHAGRDTRADADERVLDEVVGGDGEKDDRCQLHGELQGEAVAAKEVEAEDDCEGMGQVDAVGVFGDFVACANDPTMGSVEETGTNRRRHERQITLQIRSKGQMDFSSRTKKKRKGRKRYICTSSGSVQRTPRMFDWEGRRFCTSRVAEILFKRETGT